MNELALFAGAGGGILGGKLLGWNTVCACEIDPYARSVLLARQNDGTLPAFPVWDDIRTFDGRPWRGVVDVVSGGFPCQDISAAGGGGAQDLTAHEADCGQKWRGLFAKYDPASRSWRTHQFSLLGGCTEFSETWPRWGSMRDGECWELPTLERHTEESEYGLWPTPTCGGGGQTLPEGTTPQGKTPEGRKQTVCLERYVQQVERKVWPTPTASAHKGWAKGHNRADTDDRLDYTVEREASESGTLGRLNPQFVEWLMGWPIGWTELQPLATDRFQEWQRQHGGF